MFYVCLTLFQTMFKSKLLSICAAPVTSGNLGKCIGVNGIVLSIIVDKSQDDENQTNNNEIWNKKL